jgi:hypothetical protein
MHVFKIFAATALLVVPAGAAFAKEKAVAAAKEKKVCRYEDDTGSRLARHRTCMTTAEWANEDRVRQREAETSINSTQDRMGNANPPQNAPR